MQVLITSGGTREYIDPVRFISNASSGKMGIALARAALKAGHKVTLITALTDTRLKTQDSRMNVEKVHTANEMFKAVKKHFPKCDCLIMAAAVADYTPVHPSKTKIKRTGKSLTIKLKPTPDILKWAGKHKNLKLKTQNSKLQRRRRLVVGFALEDKNIRENAEKKLKEKNLDMIIANTPAAIGAEKSTVQIKTVEASWTKIENATKITIAQKIISLVANQLRT
jgi:phosphopantothenoylcysteine synthetase/decarboxylase